MKKEKITEIKSDLHERVTKSNALIQKGRYNLTLHEQKIILYIISKIGMHDSELKEIEINISDLCKMIGIADNGWNYNELKEVIKGLSDKSFYYPTIDGKGLTLMRWVEKPTFDIDPNTGNIIGGTVKIKLDQDLLPYLINLREKFTSYEILWTINFKSKYSILLYELLSSYQFNKFQERKVKFTIDELRESLGLKIDGNGVKPKDVVNKYPLYQNLKERVLEPAVKEINEKSNKIIAYSPIYEGKRVKSIELCIRSKGMNDAAICEESIETEILSELKKD